MARISVVVATYNGEKYIRQQLDSILSQTRMPDEIIISDDKSDDDTVAICYEYALKWPFIRIYSSTGGGVNHNFKIAFQYATGELIAPCDQDDIWLTNKLECLEKNMTDDVDLIYGQDYIFYDESLEDVQEDMWYLSSIDWAIWRNRLKGHTCMFRRSILYLYEHSGSLSWDYVLSFYGCISQKSKGISDFLVYWRRHKAALTFDSGENTLVLGKNRTSIGQFFECISQLRNSKNKSSGFEKFLMLKVSFLDYLTDCNIYIESERQKNHLFRNVLYYAAKQTVFSMIISGFYSVKGNCLKEDFRQLSFRHKLGRIKWAFCLPAVEWSQTHNTKNF